MDAPAPSKTLSRLCLVLSILLLTAAAYVGKMAALTTGQISATGLMANPWYLAVLFCLGCHALVWPLALRTIPLSIAYSVVNPLSLVGILIVAGLAFGERITALNLVGVAVMITGLWLLLVPRKAKV